MMDPNEIEKFRNLELTDKFLKVKLSNVPFIQGAIGIPPSASLSEEEVIKMIRYRFPGMQDLDKILKEDPLDNCIDLAFFKMVYSEDTNSNLTLAEIVRIIRIYEIWFVRDLELSEFPLEEIVKYFNYGVYRKFRFIYGENNNAVGAWLFGFGWDDIMIHHALMSSDTKITHDSNYNKKGCMSDEHAYEIMRYIDITDGTPHITIQRLLKFIAIYLELSTAPNVSNLFSTSIKSRIVCFMLEANRRGIKFCEVNRDQIDRCVTDTFDFGNVPIVQHLNHVIIMPSRPRLVWHPTPDSRYDHPIQKFTESEQFPKYFSYPKFSKSMMPVYSRDLRKIIFTTLCCFRIGLGKILPRDLLPMIFNYVVFNYYFHLEELINEWKELGEKYNKIGRTTLEDRCMDVQIDDDEQIGLVYMKSLIDLGHANIRTHREVFISHIVRKTWKVFKSITAGRSWNESNRILSDMIAECYDREIAVSLIRHGKIKISKTGEILDIEKAIELSISKRAKDKAAGLRLGFQKPNHKKRKHQ